MTVSSWMDPGNLGNPGNFLDEAQVRVRMTVVCILTEFYSDDVTSLTVNFSGPSQWSLV